jgi:hypothetical protein
MKSIFETLSVLTAGAALLTGCGAAGPVNATEVPAATEAKPSAPAAAPMETAAAATPPAAAQPAPAMPATAAPATTAKAMASAAPAPSGTPAAKPAKPKSAAGTKKTGDTASCGAGTCG